MLGRVHRPVERAEMGDAERAIADHRRELDLDRGRERQRAFRADEQMREIDRLPGRQRIEIITADTALHFRKARGDLVASRRPMARRSRVSSSNRDGVLFAPACASIKPKCPAVPSASTPSIAITLSRIVP